MTEELALTRSARATRMTGKEPAAVYMGNVGLVRERWMKVLGFVGFIFVGFIFLPVLLYGCREATQRPHTLGPNQVGHRASGIVFPESFGGSSREEIKVYDQQGNDVSIGYNIYDQKNPAVITLYVYPGPKLVSWGSPGSVVEGARKRLTDSHFEAVKKSIIEAHPKALFLREQQTNMTFKGKSLYGRMASFTLDDAFAGRVQPLITHVEIFAFGEWLIKLRMTHPNISEDAAAATLEAFKKIFAEANQGK